MTRSFVLPAAGNGTPQSTNRKRLMAEAMLAQSMGYEPIASPWQGANKLAQALMGGLIGMRADKMDARGREGANNALIRALTGDRGVAPSQADPTGAMVQGINDPYQSDIGQRMLYDKWQQDNAPPDPNAELDLKIKQLQFEQMRQPDPPKQTDDMLEYEFAVKNGYKGTPQQFWQEMKRAGSQTINNNIGASEVGTIPPGFELFTDPNTGARSMRPIPGGPAAAEAAAAAEKAKRAKQSVQDSADLVSQDIDRSLKILDNDGYFNPATGWTGNVAAHYPGSNAAKLRANLETIKANIAFDKLQAMRASSPTGGALGSVTDRDLALLTSTLGSVETAQGEGQLRYNLNRLWNVYQDIIHGPGNGPKRRVLSEDETPALKPEELTPTTDLDSLVEQYRSK